MTTILRKSTVKKEVSHREDQSRIAAVVPGEHVGPRAPARLPVSRFGVLEGENFISIRHSAEKDPDCAVPVDGGNILKLRFDDAVEDPGRTLVLFDAAIAGEIVRFVRGIDTSRQLFVNCGAGVSRSGAVGELLNDYFNKYLEFNAPDDEYFRRLNPQILPNPLVRRILRDALFGRFPGTE